MRVSIGFLTRLVMHLAVFQLIHLIIRDCSITAFPIPERLEYLLLLVNCATRQTPVGLLGFNDWNLGTGSV